MSRIKIGKCVISLLIGCSLLSVSFAQATLVDVEFQFTVTYIFQDNTDLFDDFTIGEQYFVKYTIEDNDDIIFRGEWNGEPLTRLDEDFYEFYDVIEHDASQELLDLIYSDDQYNIVHISSSSGPLFRWHLESQWWDRVNGPRLVTVVDDGLSLAARHEDAWAEYWVGDSQGGFDAENVSAFFSDHITDPGPGPGPGEPVPEPATMLLFGTGLAGLAGYRKRKAMKK